MAATPPLAYKRQILERLSWRGSMFTGPARCISRIDQRNIAGLRRCCRSGRTRHRVLYVICGRRMPLTKDTTPQGPVLDYAPSDSLAEGPARRWARAGLGLAALAIWLAATMAGASANTSWEHHPFAGPFIMLKESGSFAGYALSTFLLACILAPLGRWVWAGKVWGVVVAVVASIATVWMSYVFAAWASC